MSVKTAGIVGLGLIGGSIGAALRREGVHVRGLDANQEHACTARDRELVDEQVDDLARLCDGVDIVILAMPVSAIVDALPRIDAATLPAAVILDTGSVKRAVVRAMERCSGASRAIGGHPIAGRQKAGPHAADPDLFSGRPFVLTCTSHTDDRTLETARTVVELVGASPVYMDAEEHDTVLARTSHLPQLLASALALTVERSDLAFSGSGFADMSRLAESEPHVWRDIFLANRDNVLPAIDRYIDRLRDLRGSVESGDGNALIRLMESGKERMQGAPVGERV